MVKKMSKSKTGRPSANWKCCTHEKLNQPLKQVFACYQDFIRTYPESRWILEKALPILKSHEEDSI